jgi:hypothetical protein
MLSRFPGSDIFEDTTLIIRMSRDADCPAMNLNRLSLRSTIDHSANA